MWIYDDYIIKPRRMKKRKLGITSGNVFFSFEVSSKKVATLFDRMANTKKTHPFYFNLKLCFFSPFIEFFSKSSRAPKIRKYSVLLVIQKLHFCFIRSQTTLFCFQWEFEGKKVKTLFCYQWSTKFEIRQKSFWRFVDALSSSTYLFLSA